MQMLTIGEEKEMAEEKKKDANQRNLELQTLKHEVDQELDDFPIILDGDQKKDAAAQGENSIKKKLESVNK